MKGSIGKCYMWVPYEPPCEIYMVDEKTIIHGKDIRNSYKLKTKVSRVWEEKFKMSHEMLHVTPQFLIYSIL